MDISAALPIKVSRPKDTAKLAGLWLAPNTGMDGCSGFAPDCFLPYLLRYEIKLCGLLPEGLSQSARGSHFGNREQQKNCSTPKDAAAVFRNKDHIPYLQAWRKKHRMSSSPDWRFSGFCIAFSGFPNDRLSSNAEPPRIQWRYRRDFHPVLYSPMGLLPNP